MLLLGACVSKRAVNKRRARETRDASLRASRGVGVARGPARWRVRLPRASVRPRRRSASREDSLGGDLDAFIRRSRLRAAESVDDTRRALEDVLPASASRPLARRPPPAGRVGHARQRFGDRPARDARLRVEGAVRRLRVLITAPSARVLTRKARPPPTRLALFTFLWRRSRAPFPSPGASARSSRSSHRTPARPLPPDPSIRRSVRDRDNNAPDAFIASSGARGGAADSGRARPRLAPPRRPRADDNARVLAAMAAKARARARSAGIGDPEHRSRLTVAFDSGRDAGLFGASGCSARVVAGEA